ncbi:MAG: tRNA uridine-5-carboxymethylaminomethyl(34) synthesis GTPase MnmE, partial [Muribaculaceae bacterium]|nr:tRNA uridine-5-carboxymethylaminomethyl(34) synthesis GTPase MnmE [Muribaculaceae bacterium]
MDSTLINLSNDNSSTICAISTPQGMGGIAVIRVSGKDAVDIVNSIWRGADLSAAKSHTAHFGAIIYPATNTDLDEAVCTLFRGPRSFTGEDTVEISCHGSVWIQQQLLQILIEAGCRLALPGEFTRRAFVNGRFDLSQAEAVADVIAATSEAAHRVALSQLRGNFRNELAALRDSLIEFASLMELELDFSEEDVEFANRDKLLQLATAIRNKITALCDSFSTGSAIKNGIPVVIVGETNVGKSTLLNALLNEDKAIVSDIHGTTRDVIEDTINIHGNTFRFIDTAGLRHTDDVIENIGISRTIKKKDEAQIILWMIDATTPATSISDVARDILPISESQSLIVLINKADIASIQTIESLKAELAQLLALQKYELITISAKQHTGIDTLVEKLVKQTAGPVSPDQTIVTNARHYQALTHAKEAITRAIDGLEQGLSGDFVSQDIRETTHYLGEITGEITTTDLLTTIFSRF